MFIRSSKNQLISLLKVCCVAFLSFVYVTSCNSGTGNDKPKPKTDSGDVHDNNDSTSSSDTSMGLNWLDDHLSHGWDTVAFDCHPDSTRQIDSIQRDTRIYVRGYLAEYNAEISAINPDTVQYIVRKFNFTRKTRSPHRYTVTAFLRPGAHRIPGHGTHLIPPEPPPPKR